MTQLNDHKLPGDTNADAFPVCTDDEKGPGGAHHRYMLSHGDGATILSFQKGALAEVVPNGVTDTQLLAVLIHRLQCFQEGPFRSRENACALTHLQEAMMWQHQRTMNRMRTGIEGRSVVEGPAQPDPDALKGAAGPSA